MKKYVFAPIDILQDHRLSLIQTRVLLALHSFNLKKKNEVFPHRRTLAERAGYSEKIISRTTTQLAALGWIVKVGNGGRNKPSIYHLTHPETVTESVTVTEPVTVTDPDPKTVTDSVRGIELITITNKDKEEKESTDWELPDHINPKAWAMFEQHRVEIKKPMSDQARTINANQIKILNHAQQKLCIEASISNRWAGLFSEKFTNEAIKQNTAKRSGNSVSDFDPSADFDPTSELKLATG